MRSTRTLTLAALFMGVLSGGAQAQSSEASLAQDLANCAGAVAAHARFDVLAYPSGASGEWAPVLGAILNAMNREEGVEGMTGRYAGSAAAEYWREQSASAREAAANECRVRFGRE